MVSRIPPPEDGPDGPDGPDGSTARPQRITSAIATVLVLAVAVGFWWFSGPDTDPGSTAVDGTASVAPVSPSEVPADDASAEPPSSPEPSATPSAAPEPSSTPPPSIDPESGLPTVYLLDLPPEAAETVDNIDRGPPFPYSQDGGTFGNYEGLLPDRDRGYYQEFTVETPGSYDRGARRIVEGAEGELYWTDDHYASFSRILL